MKDKKAKSNAIKKQKERTEKNLEHTLKVLDQREMLKEAAAKSAKPVPKNILSGIDKNVKGRSYTVSIAIPGSILDNQQNPELRAYLAGQIARAAAIFNVDEIVVYEDGGKSNIETEEQEGPRGSRGVEQLSKILQYLECPQYLRKHFFPLHDDLKFAGLLNPTDMPHHLRNDEISIYREGVTTDKGREEDTCLVNIGLHKYFSVPMSLNPGLRVTVKLEEGYEFNLRRCSGTIVSPTEPRTKAGVYWGYTVRTAPDLTTVFTASPYKDGYDLTIGTSEKGKDIDNYEMDKFEHLLIVFGGVGGLETALQADGKLDAEDPKDLFDKYINVCPQQGSRTIRSEEAVFVSMAAFRPKIISCQKS